MDALVHTTLATLFTFGMTALGAINSSRGVLF